jgi:UPF0716 protein FxsA
MGLFVLFLPILEIFLFVQSGINFGWINTLFYFLLVTIVGVRLIKAGMVRATLGGPARAMGSMVWVLVGLLLVVPGFISDFVALLLAFPPTRYLFFKAQAEKAAKWAQGRVHMHFGSFGGMGGMGAGFPSQSSSGEREAQVIDIVAIDSTKTDKQNPGQGE